MNQQVDAAPAPNGIVQAAENPAPRLARDGTPEVTWTFALDEVAHGVTRLLVRARGGPGYRFHGLRCS